MEKGLVLKEEQRGGRTQGTDVGPSLPVSRKYAGHPCLVLLLLSSKRMVGENTCSFDLYKSKYKLCAKII